MTDTIVGPNAVPAPKHPRCPDCAVPMWLVKIDRHVASTAAGDRLHYECKACGGVTTVWSQTPAT
jgi:hypothetical protein